MNWGHRVAKFKWLLEFLLEVERKNVQEAHEEICKQDQENCEPF